MGVRVAMVFPIVGMAVASGVTNASALHAQCCPTLRGLIVHYGVVTFGSCFAMAVIVGWSTGPVGQFSLVSFGVLWQHAVSSKTTIE